MKPDTDSGLVRLNQATVCISMIEFPAVHAVCHVADECQLWRLLSYDQYITGKSTGAGAPALSLTWLSYDEASVQC